MDKRKILSILIISLIVLGTILFIVDNLQSSAPAAGTCCKEDESICVVGSQRIDNYYFKGVGSCKEK